MRMESQIVAILGKGQRQWSDKLDYKPPGMKKEIPYANVMRKA